MKRYIYWQESKSQCILTEDECRKVIILKNQRDNYLESWKLSEELYSNAQTQLILKDSVIQSYVVIQKQQARSIKLLTDVNQQQEENIIKLEKAVRIRNTALRIGIPIGFGLGIFTGTYLSVFLK
jgi:hypothetical protein